MDHYSIVEPTLPQPKDNGGVPSETGAQTGAATPDTSTSGADSIELIPTSAENNSAITSPAPALAESRPVSELMTDSSGADLDAALQAIVQKAQYISNASGAAIALRQGRDVVCRAASGSTAPDRGARLEIKSGLTAECLRSGELMRCDNVMLDPRVDLESCKRLGIESIIIMPIRRGGNLEGVLELFSAHAYSFQDRDVEMVKGLAEEVGRCLAEAEQPAAPLLVEEPPAPQLVDEELNRCSGCGTTLAKDAVFCTECGAFQESKPSSLVTIWKERVSGRRLLVPAIFVAMALAVAVVPGPRSSQQGAPGTTPPRRTMASAAPAITQPANPNVGASPAPASNNPVAAAPNPSIAKSVKQLLGGVSSDFSKLLPVNEKAEPASNGDPNLKVWVDTRKGFYYCPGDEQYGHTDKGSFMTQKQAESNYYIPALIKPCM